MINNASPPAANVPHTRSSSRRSPDQSTAVSGEENGSNYPRGATAAKTTPALYHEVILPKPNRQYCDGGRSPDFGGDLVCSLAAGGKAWACGSRGDPGRSVPVFPMRCAGLSGTPFLPRRPYIPLAVSNCCTAQESSVARPRPLRRNTIMFPRVLRLRPAVFDSALQNGVSCRAGLVASQRSSTAMFSVCSSARRQQGDNTQAEDMSESSNSPASAPDGLKAFRDIVISRTAASRFSDKEVDPAVLRDIMALTQSAPSSFNIQPWSVILVRDAGDRERLSTAMLGGNAKKVLSAPVTAVFCADLEPSKRIHRMVELNRQAGMAEADITKMSLAVNLFSGEGLVGNAVRNAFTAIASPMQPAPEVGSAEAWSFKNTSLAVQTYILSCTAHGLHTAPMEGFDARRVRAALDVPDRYGIPMVVPTGYPAPSSSGEKGSGSSTKRWRYPPQEVVFDGAFGVGMPGVDPVVP